MQPELIQGISVLQIVFNQHGYWLWLPLFQICREWDLWLVEDFALFSLLYTTAASSHHSLTWWDTEQHNKTYHLLCVMALT